MTEFVDCFMDWYDDTVYTECVDPFVTEVRAMAKKAAPDFRDLKANTYAAIEDAPSSNENRAVVYVHSDSKDPDVFQTAGLRNTARYKGYGRVPGTRVGVRSTTQPYANGVDLANISNGSQRGRTKRAKPMPTAGWWKKLCRDIGAMR